MYARRQSSHKTNANECFAFLRHSSSFVDSFVDVMTSPLLCCSTLCWARELVLTMNEPLRGFMWTARIIKNAQNSVSRSEASSTMSVNPLASDILKRLSYLHLIARWEAFNVYDATFKSTRKKRWKTAARFMSKVRAVKEKKRDGIIKQSWSWKSLSASQVQH